MSTDTGLLAQFAGGIATRLAGMGLGLWRPDGVYTVGQVGITLAAVPEAPDQIIALTPYPVSDDAELGDSVIGLRVRQRGDRDPRSVLDRDDAVFNALEGLQSIDIGGVYLVLMWRQASLPLSQDANQRWEISSTYYARVAWPTQHRTD